MVIITIIQTYFQEIHNFTKVVNINYIGNGISNMANKIEARVNLISTSRFIWSLCKISKPAVVKWLIGPHILSSNTTKNPVNLQMFEMAHRNAMSILPASCDVDKQLPSVHTSGHAGMRGKNNFMAASIISHRCR